MSDNFLLKKILEDTELFLNPSVFFNVLHTLVPDVPFSLNMWQKEVCNYIADELKTESKNKNILIAIAGARGCGKSRLAAFLALWILSVMQKKHVTVTFSANTESQIEKTLGLACNQLFSMLPFEIFLTKSGARQILAKNRPENRISWQVFGSMTGDPSKVRGLHSEISMRIIDEALGVKEEIIQTVLSGLTTGINIVLLLSNPVSRIGFFADIFLGANEYNFYHKNVSLYSCDHINIADPHLIQHIESVKTSDPTGERYNVEILGKFPTSTLGFFFNEFEIKETSNPECIFDAKTVIGIDVGGGEGGDRTVIAARCYTSIFVLFAGQITIPLLVEKILEYLQSTVNIAVDSAALGLGVVQSIAYRGGHVYRANGNAKSTNPSALNQKAELYIQLKSFLDNGGSIFVPHGEKNILANELRSIRVEFPDGKNGRLKIEDKEKLRHSPDIVDALSYTFLLNKPTPLPIFSC